MSSKRGSIIKLPLLSLAFLSTLADSKSFGFRRTYLSVAGGADSLASGTGAIIGYGSVDFGRAGLAGTDILPGGVDSGGEFDEAIEKVTGKRGKSGKSAEAAFILSTKGSDEGLLERGSFSLDDGQLKSRRIKDLLYKESDSGAATAKESSFAEGGERIVANDTNGFSNTYQLSESGKKSTYSDKYRHGAKFKEAGEDKISKSSDGVRKSFDEKVQTAHKAGDEKRDGAYTRSKKKGSSQEYVGKVGVKKFLNKGKEGERIKGKKRYWKKGEVGDGDGQEYVYDDEEDEDDDYDDKIDVKASRKFAYKS